MGEESREGGDDDGEEGDDGFGDLKSKPESIGKLERDKKLKTGLTMMAKAIQRIQPRAPSVESETGPGAHPEFFARGERMPHPTIMPRFIERVVGKPMIMPVRVERGFVSE